MAIGGGVDTSFADANRDVGYSSSDRGNQRDRYGRTAAVHGAYNDMRGVSPGYSSPDQGMVDTSFAMNELARSSGMKNQDDAARMARAQAAFDTFNSAVPRADTFGSRLGDIALGALGITRDRRALRGNDMTSYEFDPAPALGGALGLGAVPTSMLSSAIGRPLSFDVGTYYEPGAEEAIDQYGGALGGIRNGSSGDIMRQASGAASQNQQGNARRPRVPGLTSPYDSRRG